MFDPRNNLANEVSSQLIAHFGDKVFRTIVPRNVRLAEAPSFGKPRPAARQGLARRAGLPRAGRRDDPRKEDDAPRAPRTRRSRAARRRRVRRTTAERPLNDATSSLSSRAMSQKKPVLGRGLEALLGQMSQRPAGAGRAPARQRRVATSCRATSSPICRSICCSAASTSRASTCARNRSRSWPSRSRRRASSSRSSCAPSTAPRPANRSATRSSPASAAGAPRRSPGSPTVPAVIRRVPDEAAIAMALIENIQRENLNPLEEARALERLISEFGITHQQAAEAVGRSRAAVSQPAAPARAAAGDHRAASSAASSRWATRARCWR